MGIMKVAEYQRGTWAEKTLVGLVGMGGWVAPNGNGTDHCVFFLGPGG